MNQERPVLYINILVHDASEAVKDEVANKVKKSRIPFPLKESVANRAAARITWDLSMASKVVDMMGPRLCQEIPIKMSKKGIQVHVDNVFTEGNYLVIELQVQHVDAIVMSEAKHKKQEQDQHNGAGALFFKSVFTVIGVENQASLEREVLPNILQRKVSVSIREMMKEKLTEKKMAADVEILKEEKQARYFFQTLRQVREVYANAYSPRKTSPTPTNKASTTAAPPPTHVRKASLTDSLTSVVEAATGAVAPEKMRSGPIEIKPEKNGQRRTNSLASAVEAAAASVVATVKKGASVSSTSEKNEKAATGAKKTREAPF